MAEALANGPKEALGEDVQLFKLGKRKDAEDTFMEPKKNKEEVEPKKTEEEVEPKKTEEEAWTILHSILPRVYITMYTPMF